MRGDRPAVTGNPWVLAGSVLYLLEWVAIIPAGSSGPSDAGTAAAKVLTLYTAHPTPVLFLMSWVSAVLLGRVLLMLGLRAALRSVGAETPLLSLAVAAMTVSVVVEVLSEGVVGAATVIASRGGSQDIVLALDVLAGLCWRLIFGPLGIAVGLGAWAMLRSRAFPTWICVVGLVGGGLLLLGGILAGPGYLHPGVARGFMNAAQGAVPLFWVWMLATGIFLLRRRPGAAVA